jgi:tetratricopeptide (TPR) repeat protein
MSDQGKSSNNQLTLTGSNSLAVKRADLVRRGLELISSFKMQTLNVLLGDIYFEDGYIRDSLYEFLIDQIPKDKYELNIIGATSVEEVMENSLNGEIDIFILILNNLQHTRGVGGVFEMLFEIKQTYPRPIIALSGYRFLEDTSCIKTTILFSDYRFQLPFHFSDFWKAFEICLAMLPYYKGDFSKAFVELLPFALNGDAKAQFILGSMHANGQGVPQDYEEAIKWYKKAADPGHADPSEWFRKTADQGHADAQYELGQMYCNGLGVTVNYEEAVKWYRKAAEQGHIGAPGKLLDMYHDGQGVSHDYDEYSNWLLKAAIKRLAWLKGKDSEET